MAFSKHTVPATIRPGPRDVTGNGGQRAFMVRTAMAMALSLPLHVRADFVEGFTKRADELQKTAQAPLTPSEQTRRDINSIVPINTPDAYQNQLNSHIRRATSTLGGGTNALKMLRGTLNTESDGGTHYNTYRDGYHGGVMQIDEIGFNDTQAVGSHPDLKRKYKQIKDEYGIHWPDVKYKQLRDPELSVLASRLYYSNFGPPIGNTKRERAEQWYRLYNRGDKKDGGKGKIKDYMDKGVRVKPRLPSQSTYNPASIA